MNLGETLLTALRLAGVRELFGIPGDRSCPDLEWEGLPGSSTATRSVAREDPQVLPGIDANVNQYDPDAVAACADEIVERLRIAQTPVLMVGVEVRRFGLERQVAELAVRLGVPVVTSFMGRGLLVDSNAPLVGTYLGVAGDPVVTDLVENSDALLMLGVILSDTNLGISKKRIDLRRCVQVCDNQVRLGFHYYSEIPIAVLVEELLRRDVVWNQPPPSYAVRRETLREFVCDGQPMTPDDIAAGINCHWGYNDPLMMVSDVGDCLFVAMSIEQAHLAAPGYYASMGFSVPAGLGMQAASSVRPLILLGDGAFQMTGWELGNCTRYGWDPIIVVMNNASWEMLRAFQPESQFNFLNEWNFAAIARAMGGQSYCVETRHDFLQALQQAKARRGRFQLIEIKLARGAISHTMARFTQGLKSFRAVIVERNSFRSN